MLVIIVLPHKNIGNSLLLLIFINISYKKKIISIYSMDIFINNFYR